MICTKIQVECRSCNILHDFRDRKKGKQLNDFIIGPYLKNVD